MVSKLEDTLLRCSKRNDSVRDTLFNCLDDYTLRGLRTTCRTLHNLIDGSPARLFSKLYIIAPFPANRYVDCLERVAPFCYELVIRVYPSRLSEHNGNPQHVPDSFPNGPSSATFAPRTSTRQRWQHIRQALASRPGTLLPAPRARTGEQPMSSTRERPATSSHQSSASGKSSNAAIQNAWNDLLTYFNQVQSLHIECNGNPGWPAQSDVERTLATLRVALERASLQHLRHVHLSPVHTAGIMHLRWSGFGAFGSAPASAYPLWQNIHTLDLRIQNPFLARYDLTDSQHTTAKPVLHDYLLSFAPTLKRLRFVWLDGEGPSPMALDLEQSLRGQCRPIIWTALEEVWLGNIEFPHRTMRLLSERAPRASKMKTLRVSPGAFEVPFNDTTAWVDVLLGPQSASRTGLFDRASSVYSQD